MTKPDLTDNEKAANGPFPGDLGKIAEEWDESQRLDTPGYFKSLNGAEVADAQRSQCYPAATFLGSMTGPIRMFAGRVDVKHVEPAAIGERQAQRVLEGGHALRRQVGRMGNRADHGIPC